jgi:hypothetical protein
VWQSSEPVLSDEQTVTDGRAATSAPLDIDHIHARSSQLNDELTGITRVNVLLRMNVSYATDRYSGHVTETASLQLTSNAYWLGGSLGFEETRSTPLTREITHPPDYGAIGGLVGGGLLAMIGAALAWRAREFEDPATIKYRLDLTRCHEWVSEGRIRQPISGQDVAMDTLEDLVDVAIDSKRRVVHDDERGLYAVFDGNLLYYFDPEGDRGVEGIEAAEAEPEQPKRVRSDGNGHDDDEDDEADVDHDAWDRLMDETTDEAPEEP